MRSWRTVRRLYAIALGVWLGCEAAYWWHDAPDRAPTVEAIEYAPCR